MISRDVWPLLALALKVMFLALALKVWPWPCNFGLGLVWPCKANDVVTFEGITLFSL